MLPTVKIAALLIALDALLTAAQAGTKCTGKGVEVQVLGSGGPEVQDKRASSSYVVWRNGKARGRRRWRLRSSLW
jgi:hypothetical protein